MHQIALTVSKKNVNHINEHAFKVSTTSMHTGSQTVTPLVSRSVDDVLVKVKPSLHQAFLQDVDESFHTCIAE